MGNHKRNGDRRKRNPDFWPKRIDDHRHQRGHRGYHGREEVDESSRFIRDDVFFENELQQVCKWLEHAAVTDAIWTKPTLDEAEYATLCEHCVGDNQKHNHKSHSDGCKLESYINRGVHQAIFATDFADEI